MKRFWTEVARYAGIAVTIVVSLAPGLALNWWIATDLAVGCAVLIFVGCAVLTFVWSSFTIRLYLWVETGEWVPRPTWARVKAGYQAHRRS